jgi:1-deoxy-D-xylulose 5-phosphate reductoisomerase
VAAFLDDRIGFCDIARVNEKVLNQLSSGLALESLDEVFSIDAEARALADTVIGQLQ